MAEERKFDMHKAAVWYARRGIYVFPLHVPEFWEGGCWGCSCEEWRGTEACLQKSPHRHLKPGESCATPGKCPRVNWREKSTTDLAQIAAWWRFWPHAGVGIDCGKSRLTVLDFDTSKPGYEGDDLYRHLSSEFPTVEVITGSGGRHLLYQAPEGVRITNSAAGLPKHTDVRSVGGYVVAPPSMHSSGRRYLYEPGRLPTEMLVGPLPQFLVNLLGAPKHRREAQAATQGECRKAIHPCTGDRVADISRLVERLAAWRADDYHEWVRVGLALKGALAEDGYPLWLDFSARSNKFDEQSCERKWATFSGDGFGSGSLAFWAGQDSPVSRRVAA